MKIQERWTFWADASASDFTTEKEYVDARITFFAGATAAFTLIRDAAETSFSSVVDMITEMDKEIRAFKDELKRKAAGGSNGKARS